MRKTDETYNGRADPLNELVRHGVKEVESLIQSS